MIIVTGATGQLGHAIVQSLLRRVSPLELGVSVRDPAKAAGLEALGVRVRRGDFDDPDSLRDAFEDATQVLIVSSNAAAKGGNPLPQHRAAIDAARAVGAQRILYTSHMAASPTSAFAPARDHAATEQMLAASGVSWTALRHGFYAESGLMLMGDVAKTGVIEAPADGKVAWTTHADLAEADATILTGADRYDGPTPPLTGSAALDLADLAVIAGQTLGRPVERKRLADEDLLSRMRARGAPAAAADIALGLYVAARTGEFADIDPLLEKLLGRPATTMHALIAAHFNQVAKR